MRAAAQPASEGADGSIFGAGVSEWVPQPRCGPPPARAALHGWPFCCVASALNYGNPLLITSYSRLYTTTTYCLCNNALRLPSNRWMANHWASGAWVPDRERQNEP